MMPLAMKFGLVTCAILSAVACGSFAADDQQPLLLEPGAYEVTARLELPNLADMMATRTTTICVAPARDVPTRGFAVLSENNPLSRCPVSNVAKDGATLSFDIRCAGSNTGEGRAVFTLGPTSFYGRIAMKMGGKNMTMTEIQAGRRVGDCSGAKSSARGDQD